MHPGFKPSYFLGVVIGICDCSKTVTLFFFLFLQCLEIIYRWEIEKEGRFNHLPEVCWNYAAELSTKCRFPSVLGPRPQIISDLRKQPQTSVQVCAAVRGIRAAHVKT